MPAFLHFQTTFPVPWEMLFREIRAYHSCLVFFTITVLMKRIFVHYTHLCLVFFMSTVLMKCIFVQYSHSCLVSCTSTVLMKRIFVHYTHAWMSTHGVQNRPWLQHKEAWVHCKGYKWLTQFQFIWLYVTFIWLTQLQFIWLQRLQMTDSVPIHMIVRNIHMIDSVAIHMIAKATNDWLSSIHMIVRNIHMIDSVPIHMIAKATNDWLSFQSYDCTHSTCMLLALRMHAPSTPHACS